MLVFVFVCVCVLMLCRGSGGSDAELEGVHEALASMAESMKAIQATTTMQASSQHEALDAVHSIVAGLQESLGESRAETKEMLEGMGAKVTLLSTKVEAVQTCVNAMSGGITGVAEALGNMSEEMQAMAAESKEVKTLLIQSLAKVGTHTHQPLLFENVQQEANILFRSCVCAVGFPACGHP